MPAEDLTLYPLGYKGRFNRQSFFCIRQLAE